MAENKIKPGCVKTIAELANIAGVHSRQISEWKKREGFPTEPDGTYNIWKISEWRERTFNKKTNTPAEIDGIDLNKIKARKIVADTKVAEEDAIAKELKNRQTLKELVSRVAVKRAVNIIFTYLRQVLEAYPARAATEFPEETRSDNVESLKQFIRIELKKLAKKANDFEDIIE